VAQMKDTIIDVFHFQGILTESKNEIEKSSTAMLDQISISFLYGLIIGNL